MSQKQLRKTIRRTRDLIAALRVATESLVNKTETRDLSHVAPAIGILVLAIERQVKLCHKLERKLK